MTLASPRQKCILLMCLLLCACGGVQINPSNISTVLMDFKQGSIALDRDNPIALPDPWYRRRVFALWQKKAWANLAKAVIEDGFDMDLNWFYLGEAARGGGYAAAAQIYYRKAYNDSVNNYPNRRCSSFPGVTRDLDMCSSFVFPRDIQMRLKVLDNG